MSEVWTFQVIRLDGPNVPIRVLEEGFMPRATCTREVAKDILQDRCKGESYRITGGPSLRPEGVRFLDDKGSEVMRYTVIDLHREGGQIAPDKES